MSPCQSIPIKVLRAVDDAIIGKNVISSYHLVHGQCTAVRTLLCKTVFHQFFSSHNGSGYEVWGFDFILGQIRLQLHASKVMRTILKHHPVSE